MKTNLLPIAQTIKITSIVSLVLLLSACASPNVKSIPVANTDTTTVGAYQVTNEVATLSGLTWSRCPLGMTVEDSKCQGVVKRYTLDEAKAAAQDSDLAGYNDWRLPTSDDIRHFYFTPDRYKNPDIKTAIPVDCKGKETTVTSEITKFELGKEPKESTETHKELVGEKECKFWIGKSRNIFDVFTQVYNLAPNTEGQIPAKIASKDSKMTVMLVRGKINQ